MRRSSSAENLRDRVADAADCWRCEIRISTSSGACVHITLYLRRLDPIRIPASRPLIAASTELAVALEGPSVMTQFTLRISRRCSPSPSRRQQPAPASLGRSDGALSHPAGRC